MATDTEIEEAWVNGWTQAYHDLWDIFAIANADETPDAEQRANDAEARAERLAAVLEETYQYLIWLRKPIDLPDSRWPFTCAEATLDDKIRAALTAPATQPDERAAAERALLDRLAKRILAEIVYCAPENRALAEEVARVARIETDLIVARYGDTDGAAKEE